MPGIWDTIDAAHTALRMVDASDQTAVQTERTLDAVAAAVKNIECVARDRGHVLPEWRPMNRPMRVPGGAQT